VPNPENTIKEWQRSLATRLKRIERITNAGERLGTAVELEAAEKDVARATGRLSVARIAHATTTWEAQDFANSIRALGGTADLPEGFTVYTNPEAVPAVERAHTGQPLVDFDPENPADQVDAAGNFTDPDRDGTANLDETDGEPVDQRVASEPVEETEVQELVIDGDDTDAQPRKGGRFARRGQVV